MEALTFIAVLSCLGLVLAWHLYNEAAGSPGEKGLLGTQPGKRPVGGRSYALKSKRLGRRGASVRED